MQCGNRVAKTIPNKLEIECGGVDFYNRRECNTQFFRQFVDKSPQAALGCRQDERQIVEFAEINRVELFEERSLFSDEIGVETTDELSVAKRLAVTEIERDIDPPLFQQVIQACG